MTTSSQIDFWYEFASPYSYLSAMRIENEAQKFGVKVNWKPFLLGPIFRAQGYTDSPFNTFPLKRDYMWRDVERTATDLNLPFNHPEPFPGNGLQAARIALFGIQQGWGHTFTKILFREYFGEGVDIANPDNLKEVIRQCTSENADTIWTQSQSANNKAALKTQTEQAQRLNIFGAPTFISDSEMYWGNDRLETALKHAAQRV
ncbi:MAG: 2-hydroxychromene-2-carboxylate isomerase [Magnetovibrio sp.]|nr:2-hydroxychromene-2-carboxylate isomerase [Magnetovibrio sp.]